MAVTNTATPRKVRLDAEELSILCEQISLILRSGLPLHDGVEALCDNYRQTRFAQRFEAMNQAVLSSGSLYLGLVEAGIFPKYMAEMARIGERTGELDTVMTGLSLYYQREAKMRRAIVNAVTYPLILVGMMAVLITILITQVLPIFQDVYRGMGIETANNPWVSAGVDVGKGVLIAVAVVIALLLLLMALVRLDASGRVKTFIFRWFRPLRRMNNQISASRFASVMAMMLRSGFPLDESLSLISGVISDEDVAKRVDACRTSMECGLSFPDAVDKLEMFETLHSRMIRVGFQAGQTDQVMRKLAEIYEDKVDDTITRSVSMIEPSLVALMSVIIGAILLAVMLPLLSLMGGMV